MDDFTPIGGNSKGAATNWTGNSAPSTVFVSFPPSGQPAAPEVGYDEGAYGDGGYDSPAVPSTVAQPTNWTAVVSK